VIRLLRYELRRLLLNKFFPGLLLIALAYSYFILQGEVIFGIANTAPFSGWSYGWFLSRVAPLLTVAMLFFVSFFFSGEEKRVQPLVWATPVDYRRYLFFRALAMAAGFLIVAAAAVALSLVCYLKWFGFAPFGNFILPIILTLLPPMLLALGLGMLAGRFHIGLIYALAPVFLVLGQMPGFPDLFGGGFYSDQPPLMGLDAGGEPFFYLPFSFWVQRLACAAVGILAAGCGILLTDVARRPPGKG
jgi:hypothetical protein